MTNNINLVSKENIASIKEKNRLKILRSIAVASLIVVALASVLIFIIDSQIGLSSIKKEENSTIQNISYLNKRIAKLAIINNRLKDISDIMQKRKNYSSLIAKFIQIIPSGVRISAIEIDKNDLTISVNSNSLLALDQFLNDVNGLSQKKQYISGLIIESLSINKSTGAYSLTLKTKIL